MPYFRRQSERERTLVMVYTRTIMVGCSENIINSPDQFRLQAISPLLYGTLLASEYIITPLL